MATLKFSVYIHAVINSIRHEGIWDVSKQHWIGIRPGYSPLDLRQFYSSLSFNFTIRNMITAMLLLEVSFINLHNSDEICCR